jgi:hypothetical protein
MHQAGAALAKFRTNIIDLISTLDEQSDISTEAVHCFFGLLAQFWNCGGTARQHAIKNLQALSIKLKWNEEKIDHHVQGAKVFFQDTDLATADHIELMLFENNQRQIVEKFLTQFNDLSEGQRQRILNHFSSNEALKKADIAGIKSCGVPESVAKQIIIASKENLDSNNRSLAIL